MLGKKCSRIHEWSLPKNSKELPEHNIVRGAGFFSLVPDLAELLVCIIIKF